MLGDKIKDLRKLKKITQQKLAKSIGLSQSSIGMIESNKQGASNETLVKLAKLFDVTVDYLLGTDEIENIGYIIKEEREYQGITQKELSDAVGINENELAKYENNEAPISQFLAKKIANFFDMSFPAFLNKYGLYGDIPSQFNGDADWYESFKKAAYYDANSNTTPNKVAESSDIYETINKDMSNVINIPIVGVVRAGKPILAQDNISGYLPTLKQFIDNDKDYFYLKVKGDSMNQEFKEGSLLLIEKTPCIENGQIGVVLIDGMEATVKKIVKNENMITLIPMSNNPEYVPKMYDIKKDEIQIIGVVKQATKIY
ncbi:helix-turn-helix domain-containing protein [Clostridium ljungdahlii]|uniref:LexA repressor n=1 Tax=Clostridium ljungdahlii (strain ATCC 55383 / DSM 13528 / PETC) TaxID=748727 RepID=D8GTA9_CLOLD|nr:helix-turn-helix domain-containing protein [Clostridium ljungdahlii]ADK16708.1 predicted transcriptional regulator [Clostridium ljungdahlii DSM 13528]OAA89416.1 LexA repressor [Clostridium ljungdahlii DSM 13528]